MILKSDMDLMIASNLNWSFPLPVHPCAIAVAPSFSAISMIFIAIKGLASAVLNGYPSYSAFALIPLAMYSLANSSLASIM